MSKFVPISGSKWIDPEEFDSNERSSKSLKGCVCILYMVKQWKTGDK